MMGGCEGGLVDWWIGGGVCELWVMCEWAGGRAGQGESSPSTGIQTRAARIWPDLDVDLT